MQHAVPESLQLGSALQHVRIRLEMGDKLTDTQCKHSINARWSAACTRNFTPRLSTVLQAFKDWQSGVLFADRLEPVQVTFAGFADA